ncbi:hypothetical protein ABIA38_000879 [Embleya sp. AB8]
MGRLRVAAGRYPDDADLAALITELSTRSPDFRRIWATGKVLVCGAGRKQIRHPVVGLLHLDYETLQVPAPTGETAFEVHVFCAPEHSPAAAAPARLAAIVSPAG